VNDGGVQKLVLGGHDQSSIKIHDQSDILNHNRYKALKLHTSGKPLDYAGKYAEILHSKMQM